jgi:hypothetical protein
MSEMNFEKQKVLLFIISHGGFSTDWQDCAETLDSRQQGAWQSAFAPSLQAAVLH